MEPEITMKIILLPEDLLLEIIHSDHATLFSILLLDKNTNAKTQNNERLWEVFYYKKYRLKTKILESKDFRHNCRALSLRTKVCGLNGGLIVSYSEFLNDQAENCLRQPPLESELNTFFIHDDTIIENFEIFEKSEIISLDSMFKSAHKLLDKKPHILFINFAVFFQMIEDNDTLFSRAEELGVLLVLPASKCVEVSEDYKHKYNNILWIAVHDESGILTEYSKNSLHSGLAALGKHNDCNGPCIAAMHVARAASILKAHKPELGAKELRTLLIKSAKPTTEAENMFDGGLLDLNQALKLANEYESKDDFFLN